MGEMAAELLKLEADKIEVVPPSAGDESKYQVLSDEELHMLLDRSPEVFVERCRGWTNVDGEVSVDVDQQKRKRAEEEVERVAVDGKKAAFAVYEAPKGDGSVNDALARMLGEDD